MEGSSGASNLAKVLVGVTPDLCHFTGWARAFFTDEFEYEREAREKFWKDEKVPGLLAKLTEALAALPEWNHDACDAALRGVAAAEGVKAGLLINATRVAIVGRAVAPPLFDTMVVLGRERVVSRLRRALVFCPRGRIPGTNIQPFVKNGQRRKVDPPLRPAPSKIRREGKSTGLRSG